MQIILIAAIAKNNVIGAKNKLPWYFPEDLKRFKELTMNSPVIMGKTTYLSILNYLGKPLPGRTNIVLTKNQQEIKEGFNAVTSIDEALAEAKKHAEKVYVIGGASIYAQMLPLANKLEITEIHKEYDGDIFFPQIDRNIWVETARDDKHGSEFDYSFVTYKKNQKRGVFIAFEGIDGCGKSTQIRELVKHIFEKDKHNHIILTRNPYKDTNIRAILREDNDPITNANKLAEVFVNDRKKHVEEIVLPNLKHGHFVVTDRYKLSTISYQGAQGIPIPQLIEMHANLPIPNITFIVDVSPEEASRRMQQENVSIRGKEHKFEAHLEFVKKIHANYKNAPNLFPNEKIFIINGERSREEISNEIKNIFNNEMENLQKT